MTHGNSFARFLGAGGRVGGWSFLGCGKLPSVAPLFVLCRSVLVLISNHRLAAIVAGKTRLKQWVEFMARSLGVLPVSVMLSLTHTSRSESAEKEMASLGDYRCAGCGYGIATFREGLRCPMCGAQVWEAAGSVQPRRGRWAGHTR